MCNLKRQSRTCHFYNRVDKYKEHPDLMNLSVVDIEDIVKLGNTHKFCPYYMSKGLFTTADIVFMPYNYLLDPIVRKVICKYY